MFKSSQVKSSLSILIFGAMTLFASCKNPKDELLPQDAKTVKTTTSSSNSFRVSNDSIFQQNGRLVFRDASVLQNTVNALANMSFEEKQAFENKFENYTSWRKFNQDNAGNDNVFPLYFKADESSLPTFVTAFINTKREYQIDKTIVYLEEGNTYEIPEAQENSLKQEGKFTASNLSSFQTNTFRIMGNGKYQYQYRRGNTDYKQVFEVGNAQGTGFGVSYLAQKLEYWGRISWSRSDWRQAGELRTMSVDNYTVYTSRSGVTTNIRTFSGNYLTNVNRDNEILIPVQSASTQWQHDISVPFMEMYVPSHNQVSYYTPAVITTPRGFIRFNATFTR